MDDITILKGIRNNDNVSFMYMLLNNDRAQVLNHVAKANPQVYKSFEDVFTMGDNKEVAQLLTTLFASNKLTFPPMEFVPKQGKGFETIERHKMIQNLKAL